MQGLKSIPIVLEHLYLAMDAPWELSSILHQNHSVPGSTP